MRSPGSRYGENMKVGQVLAQLGVEADRAINEVGRLIQSGELDLDALATSDKDLFIEAAITPKGLKEIGYGTS